MINRHRRWVLHRSSQHPFHREWWESPEIALYQVHLHTSHRASSLFAWPWLSLNHRSLAQRTSFCSCSCSCALTPANCHYALWRQISYVHVTLLWRECFYGAIWSWILSSIIYSCLNGFQTAVNIIIVPIFVIVPHLLLPVYVLCSRFLVMYKQEFIELVELVR